MHTVFFHCYCVVGCVNLICGKVVLSLEEQRGRWDEQGGSLGGSVMSVRIHKYLL